VDRVLLGDNQFFGVSHLSDERARAQSMRFRDSESILRVLDDSIDCGVTSFMCTTHDRMTEVCESIRSTPGRYRDFKILPCMPYAHKYANALTELGVVGMARQYMPGNILSTVARGGLAFARKDFLAMMQLAIDAEMKMFRGIDTPVVFLQNVVTDLLLGLGMNDVLLSFSQYVHSKHGAEAGFITMNLPMAAESLAAVGIERPIISASINKLGFRMSGGVEAYAEVIRSGKVRVVAMQVLAAGALGPREAFEFVCGLRGIESVVFGASSKAHIEESKALIESLSVESR
jgi:hypothetical protein